MSLCYATLATKTNTIIIVTAIIILSWSIVGCTGVGNDANSENKLADKVVTSCVEPRPQLCTREYNPVCALHDDGRMTTASTACTACTDSMVSGYYPGACE